jgi:pimeloyl-ACP methyl ester carboxylesterase
MSTEIKPYQISVPDSRIQTLNSKLDAALFPDELDSAGWDMGAPLADIQRLVNYWRHDFSWRKVEERLNQLPHFSTSIQCEGYESLAIHFLHKKSHVKGAIPLLFVHGWPGSFLEAAKIIDSLSTGGNGKPAFHVVAPSIPNFGFSEGTKKRGFSMEQYAETLHKLMLRLGYDQYVTQGGDWGWYITRAMSMLYPAACKATHFNMDVGNQLTFLSHPWLYVSKVLNPFSRPHGLVRQRRVRLQSSPEHKAANTGLSFAGQSRRPPGLDLRKTARLDGQLSVDRRGDLHVGEHLLVQHRWAGRRRADILRNWKERKLG